jgi:hypothetical protein
MRRDLHARDDGEMTVFAKPRDTAGFVGPAGADPDRVKQAFRATAPKYLAIFRNICYGDFFDRKSYLMPSRATLATPPRSPLVRRDRGRDGSLPMSKKGIPLTRKLGKYQFLAPKPVKSLSPNQDLHTGSWAKSVAKALKSSESDT